MECLTFHRWNNEPAICFNHNAHTLKTLILSKLTLDCRYLSTLIFSLKINIWNNIILQCISD
jgi:hypothetical protein